jgi:hypothetical protein
LENFISSTEKHLKDSQDATKDELEIMISKAEKSMSLDQQKLGVLITSTEERLKSSQEATKNNLDVLITSIKTEMDIHFKAQRWYITSLVVILSLIINGKIPFDFLKYISLYIWPNQQPFN